MMLKEGGWGAWLALLLGLVGLLVGAGAGVTLLFSRRGAFWVGVASLVIATMASGVGLLGMVSGRHRTDAALMALDSQTAAERIRREGYLEAAQAAKVGFGASLVPLLFGLLSVGLGAGAKPKSTPPYAPMNAAFAPPPPKPTSSAGRWIAGGVVASFALLTSIGAFAGNAAPPPQGKYNFLVADEDAWALAEAREKFDTDRLHGCDDLDAALVSVWASGDRRQWPRVFLRDPDPIVPDWRSAATMCVQTIWTDVHAKGSTTAPGYSMHTKTWTAEALLDSPLLVDERLHSDILAYVNGPGLGVGDAGVGDTIGLGQLGNGGRFARDGGAGRPSVTHGSTTVMGRLPPEVIQRIVRQNTGRFRLCYENALRSDPTLEGTVKVKFVIGTDGEVSSASDAGSDLPDATARDCVIRGFKNLSFPQPEGGIVVVTYPLHFAPSR